MSKLDIELEESVLDGDKDIASHFEETDSNEKEPSLSDPESGLKDDDGDGALLHPRAVSFEVCLEVGQINLSLEQIQSLKVGDSLEFIKWPSKVKLRLNRSIFAEGYLVEVNGMLGVKITNKFSN